jgi:hypothetical protein
MSEKLEGKITGINLTNFLQIVQMEKPTVTLLIAKGSKKGALYIENGEIIDAETKSGLKNLDAAYEIISWDDSSIELKKEMPKKERIIKMPLMNILMEALRLKDEKPQENDEEEAEEEISDIEISIEEENEPEIENLELETNEEPEQDLFPDSEETFEDLDSISFDPKDYKPVDNNQNQEKQKNLLEDYDIGIELEKSAPVKDFTEHIIHPEPKAESKEDKEDKAPSIEDFIEKKSPWKKIVLVSIIAIALVSGLSAGGFIYLKNAAIKKDYSSLISNLDKMNYEDQKISLLKKFISRYPDSEFGNKAQSKLDSILKRSQKESFEIMIEKVEKLPVDDNYQELASRYYENFLQRFPQGQYSDKTKNLLANIPQIIKKYEFDQIKAIPDSNPIEKISEIEKFKEKYPDSFSDDINKIKIKTGDYYFSKLETEIKNVSSLESFENLKEKISSFKTLFPNHPDNYKTSRLLRNLEDNKWADALLSSAKNQTSSIEEEKNFLKTYIQKNNNFKLVNAANKRIREIDYILSQKEKFENIISYASNKNYSQNNRINRLKAYIHSDILPEYKNKAQQKLNELETGKSEVLNKKETSEKTASTSVDTAKKNINEMIRNNYTKALSVSKKLSGSKRFEVTGKFSFKDSLTGKTWLLLDSSDFSDKDCYFFKDAKEAAEKINIDSYSDWRIPTEQELLTLYKNRPFFPVEKNIWFWSGDIFEKGFNTYSAAITDRQTEQREKLNKNIFTDCGNFKAVRP